MTAAIPAVAIVLAGGRSRRFGADKLTAPLSDGRPLLAHAVAAVEAVAGAVIVVLAPGAEPPVGLSPATALVRDRERYAGPLAALATGLEATTASIALVVGGDMPALEPAVLRRLVAALVDDPAVDAARLELDPEADLTRAGRSRLEGERSAPLPCALRVEPARKACADAIAAGDLRLRGCLERLATATVPAAQWRVLDPNGRTLVDVDGPDDLARLLEGE